MPHQLNSATINGAPSTDVTIYPRDKGSEPPPSVFEGAINSNGRLKLLLPPGDYAVVSSSGTLPLKIEEHGPDSVTLDLGKS